MRSFLRRRGVHFAAGIVLIFAFSSLPRQAVVRLNPGIASSWGHFLEFGLLGWLYLLQASQVAGYAHDIRTLQLEKERLHRDSIVLRGRVAVIGSLERVRAAAEDLGYALPDAADSSRHLVLEYEPPEGPEGGTVLPEGDADRASPPPPEADSASGGLLRPLWADFVDWLNASDE